MTGQSRRSCTTSSRVLPEEDGGVLHSDTMNNQSRPVPGPPSTAAAGATSALQQMKPVRFTNVYAAAEMREHQDQEIAPKNDTDAAPGAGVVCSQSPTRAASFSTEIAETEYQFLDDMNHEPHQVRDNLPSQRECRSNSAESAMTTISFSGSGAVKLSVARSPDVKQEVHDEISSS
eukprot:GSA120T00020947001.1